MEKIIIRESKEEDFPELIELNELIWNLSNTPAVISFESAEDYGKHFPRGSQFVAIINDSVAGYIDYKNPTPLASNNHVLEIDMGVHPEFQRMGVGRALMEFMINFAKEKEYKKLSLRVLATNQSAISFYQANGFKEQGRLVKEFLLEGKLVDDILMYQFL